MDGLRKNKNKNTKLLELSVKLRKTQHQNPEFGHTRCEIFLNKKTCKRVHYYCSIQHGLKLQKTINFGGKLSFILSFHFPQRLPPRVGCCYIYLHCFYSESKSLVISSVQISPLKLCTYDKMILAIYFFRGCWGGCLSSSLLGTNDCPS